LALIILFLIF